MPIVTAIEFLRPMDYVALVTLFAGWWAISWRIEHPHASKPSVSVLMGQYRRLWMQEMVHREPRIFDAQMIGHLRQGAAFFASSSMLAIGGGIALIGNTDQLRSVARDLTQRDDPVLIWEIKLILLLLLISTAFLKYVWALRLFGYTTVLMSAVPNNPNGPQTAERAAQAGDISRLAARAFTRGMRTTYFALASAAWLLGPWAMIVAALATVTMLWRREFASNARDVLLRVPANLDH
ncbi:MAG: DUF599 domain-containing protein [Aliishimia sp.]